ncbi:MAG: hypothetical protein ISR39_08165 [Akkermansiaceae bacterium]|nr:hypothetical protein [Akkermansiaceae bacterium]
MVSKSNTTPMGTTSLILVILVLLIIYKRKTKRLALKGELLQMILTESA